MRRLLSTALLAMLLAAGCGPTATGVDTNATATSVREAAAARSTAQEVARTTETAAPAATSAAKATATRDTEIAHLEATATAQALQTLVERAVAATAAAQPTATPVPPTATLVPARSTPVPQAATETPVPAAPAQPQVIIIGPQYVPVPVPVTVPSYGTPQFAIDSINSSNNAYAAAKCSLNQRELEAGMAGRELVDGRAEVQGLIQNRTRVVSTLVRGNVTYWNYVTPTRMLVSTDEVWRFTNYNADTYGLKRDNGARLYRNDYTIDLLGGRWVVTLDSVPNRNGEAI